MDIPDWFLWAVLGFAVLQAAALVRIVRRLRESDRAVRSMARLELLDAVSTLMFMTGLVLSLAVAASWVWLLLAGFVLMIAVYAVKGLALLRARRRTVA
ncbi:hypothetical protein N7925_27100 [Streptomyces sp. CA-278952]|uniref:hypothetical protein n=1 Tax=unclassified Streptomyces TaxID=2593676 RepID=UPI002368C24F|nr:hypothetical protein [Streptomyces sp. CA-278952]WDG31725.1 hypothetical protein N7925_27100 [Streptomyces sp. CA-278952]